MSAPYGQLQWGDHVVVCGLQQTGKSTLARSLVKGARRVFVFDPKGDYAEKIKGAEAIAPADLEEKLAKVEEGKEPRFVYVVLAGRTVGVDIADEFRYMVRKVREFVSRTGLGVVVVADELVLYGQSAAQTLRALMANGHGISPKHGGIVTLLVCQRAVDLPLGCRALATRAYGFRQSHPADLARLRDEFGRDFMHDSKTWTAGEEPAYWEQEVFYGKARS